MDTNGKEWDMYSENCPTRLALDRIADKWTVLIVAHLAKGTQRFGELRQVIKGISPKVLTQALRALERDGLITRHAYATIPPKVEYTITPLGRTLIKLFDEIQSWAETHVEHMLSAQVEFDRAAELQER